MRGLVGMKGFHNAISEFLRTNASAWFVLSGLMLGLLFRLVWPNRWVFGYVLWYFWVLSIWCAAAVVYREKFLRRPWSALLIGVFYVVIQLLAMFPDTRLLWRFFGEG